MDKQTKKKLKRQLRRQKKKTQKAIRECWVLYNYKERLRLELKKLKKPYK